MSKKRIIDCDCCGGDGGFDEVVGHCPDGPIWRWFKCECCGGYGEVEVELQPVDMEDVE